jgi:hypothetical protein
MSEVLGPYWKRTLGLFRGMEVRLTRTDGQTLEGKLVGVEDQMARIEVIAGAMPRAVRYSTLLCVEGWR